MSKNFPSFVCYPTNRENFQSTPIRNEREIATASCPTIPWDKLLDERLTQNDKRSFTIMFLNQQEHNELIQSGYDETMQSIPSVGPQEISPRACAFLTKINSLSNSDKNSLYSFLLLKVNQQNTQMGSLSTTLKNVLNDQDVRLLVENVNKFKRVNTLPLGITVQGPTHSDRVGGSEICVDDTCFNTDDFKNILKSIIVLGKRLGTQYN